MLALTHLISSHSLIYSIIIFHSLIIRTLGHRTNNLKSRHHHNIVQSRHTIHSSQIKSRLDTPNIHWVSETCVKIVPQDTFIIGPEPINTNQCIEVLTTGLLAATSCNLPIHCGTEFYSPKTSTWWGTKVGLCIGMGLKPQVIDLKKQLLMQPGWLIGYQPVFDCPTIPIYHSNLILHDLINDSYYVISPYFAKLHPIYSITNRSFIEPTTIQQDGDYCIPYIQSTVQPYKLGPFNLIQALQHSFLVQEDAGPVRITSNQQLTQTAVFYAKTQTVVETLQNSQIQCDPPLTTTNYLPATISSIPKTIANTAITLFETVFHYLQIAFDRIARYLAKILDPFIFIINFYFWYYKQRRSFTDGIISTLVFTLIITNVSTFLSFIHSHN